MRMNQIVHADNLLAAGQQQRNFILGTGFHSRRIAVHHPNPQCACSRQVDTIYIKTGCAYYFQPRSSLLQTLARPASLMQQHCIARLRHIGLRINISRRNHQFIISIQQILPSGIRQSRVNQHAYFHQVPPTPFYSSVSLETQIPCQAERFQRKKNIDRISPFLSSLCINQPRRVLTFFPCCSIFEESVSSL